MIRVLLGQPDALVRGALAAVLAMEPAIRIVAALSSSDDLSQTAVDRDAEVAVVDARLPGTTTVPELCRTLRYALPRCRPLVLLEPGPDTDLGRALLTLTPWLGLLATDRPPPDLVTGVRRLASGAPMVDTRLADAARSARANPLTGREREVLRLAASGAPPKEIAHRLGLDVGTVRNHLSRGVAKTGARTRLEATRGAQAAGWI